MVTEMVAPPEKLKEMLDRNEQARQDHHLMIKMYEMLVNMECDMRRDNLIGKMREMKKDVEKLNREIKYMEDETAYIDKCRHEKLREIY